MNTPPQKKRYKPKPLNVTAGTFHPGVRGETYAPVYAQIVSMFVHLELTMQDVLAVLLADSNSGAAGFVWRTIMSPKARIDLMTNLLENGKPNAHLDEEYDEIIREFRSINSARNDYVHGLWQTAADQKTAYLTKPRDDTGTFGLESPLEPIENLTSLLRRITALDFKAKKKAGGELGRRQYARHVQPSP